MSRVRRVMLGILLLAAAVRVWGIGFGLPFGNARPDEIPIAGAAVGYMSGDLRPGFFQWPPLFQYLVAILYFVYAVVGRPWTGFTSVAAFVESRRYAFNPFLYIPRALSAAFGVATVWGVFAMGRRAFDTATGVVAALFLSLAFLHVRESHFGVTDTPMTALVVFAVLLIVGWRQEGGVRRAVAAGVMSGLAGAMKYNGLGTAAAFAVAWLLRAVETPAPRARGARQLILEGCAYGAALLVAFFGTTPYVILDWPRFLSDVRIVQQTLEEGNGIVLGRGWWYFARVILPAALGWPMFIAGFAGTIGLLATRWREAATVLAFPIAYYVVAGRGYGVFARYVLPVVPFLCLTAAWFVVQTARLVSARFAPARQTTATAVLAAIVVAPSAVDTVLLDRLLARTDNRVVTARVLVDAIPPGATFYQTGDPGYGMPPFADRRTIDVRHIGYDEAARAFDPGNPEWVLVQRSPLVMYSPMPAGLDVVLREHYRIVRTFGTGDPDPRGRLYDQQDAFFLPLTGLAGLERPGPSFELYVRR